MGAKDRTALRIAGLGCAVAIVLCLLLVVAPMLAMMNHGHHCPNNLKQLGLVVRMYANYDPNGLYPLLSPLPGKLMFDPDGVYPDYLTDTYALGDPPTGSHDTLPLNDRIDDYTYLYLGYALTCDDEIEAFAEVYETRLAEDLPFDRDLPAPEGKGSGGGDVFLRLRNDIELPSDPEASDADANPDDAGLRHVPIMIGRRGLEGASKVRVLYHDGHVAHVPLGTWPITDRTMRALERMDALGEAP
ncbi:MAG: hypothetical protein GY851_04385 [bacterium]|nr:hypothetical protein [bacterium]